MADGAVSAADEDAALDRWLGFNSVAADAVASDELQSAREELGRLRAEVALLKGAAEKPSAPSDVEYGGLLYSSMAEVLLARGPAALVEEMQAAKLRLFSAYRRQVAAQGWVV